MKKLAILIWFLVINLNGENIYAMFDVQAEKETTLTLEVSGIIKKIDKDVGDIVKKGDVLLSLNNDQQREKVKKAEVEYKYALSSYNRYAKVKNVIDKEQFEKIEFNKDMAEIGYNLAKSDYEKTILKAPFDGIISERFVEIGSGISGVQLTKLLRLTSTPKVKLILTFDEKYWKDVQTGNNFRYKVDGEKEIRVGKISKVYPTIDPNTRKITAEVKTEGIPSGLFGDGYIVIEPEASKEISEVKSSSDGSSY